MNKHMRLHLFFIRKAFGRTSFSKSLIVSAVTLTILLSLSTFSSTAQSSAYTISLDLTVLLEGPFNGVDMNTSLNSKGYLPLSQPYHTSPWSYTGTETVTSIPNANVVDWILLELRDTPGGPSTATNTTVIARKAAFLLKDGSVVDIDGSSIIEITAQLNSNLFVCLYHRNHIAIMSAAALVKTSTVYSYDFTTASTQIFGGTIFCKEIGNGVWGMIGGDGNADGNVNNKDRIDIWTPQFNMNGYLSGDYNMDSKVDSFDKDHIQAVNSGRSTNVPDYGVFLPELTLSVPLVVNEGDAFNVTVTSNTLTIENAIVHFNELTYTTDVNGRASFTAPFVESDTIFLLTAQKQGYIKDSNVITIRDQEPIVETGWVSGTVKTAGNSPLSNADVCAIFTSSMGSVSRKCTLTDTLGAFIITDLIVGSYSLEVGLQGYDTSTQQILISKNAGTTINIVLIEEGTPPVTIKNGWVSGIVKTTAGAPLFRADVCIILSSDGQAVTRKCTLTNNLGVFTITDLVAGSYSLEVGLQGYVTSTQQILISKNTETNINIALIAETSPADSIQTAIESGTVGAKITIDSEDITRKPVIDYYTERRYTLNILQTTDSITCTVDAQDGSAGTFFVFDLSKDLFANQDAMKVSFDGEEIQQMSLDQFLHPEQLIDAAYFLLSTQDTTNVVVYVPHFSEHSIVIYTLEQVIDELGGTTAAIIYTACILLTAFAAIVHLKIVWKR